MSAPKTNWGQVFQVHQAAINVSGSGNNTVVAAKAGYRIIVLLYKIVCSAAVTVTWESSGGAVLDGPCSFAANGGESSPYSEHGHFVTNPSEGLVIDLGAPVQVGGHVIYGWIPNAECAARVTETWR